ncbi:F-box/LRR-repeat protein [Populus alba x Populus x berolinensis]|uniref:F-box/LRR-repeat protein n=1 Tax=Populus alba x Populus x berolinensis TaxID=444605 RepID=A0AAD6Q3J3_9ROSI|nr:F-box/LRR-repeat protein [Populus alba x Populus x berolinensis]
MTSRLHALRNKTKYVNQIRKTSRLQPQLENSENTTMEEKPKEPKMTMTSFASINEDLVQNIIKRLPASSFASAACVSKSWNQICNQILSKPKFASAFSLNPNEKVALEEVVNKVLSEPIRPHFAIANVIGSGVDLREKLDFLATKLGSQTPIIVSCASGIMGRDVVTGEHREVMLEEYWADGESNSCFGIILTVGFLPGLKVDVIPLLQPRKVHRLALVDDFVMNIRHYATSVSGWASTYQCHVKRDTVIVGDGESPFLVPKWLGVPQMTMGAVNIFLLHVALIRHRGNPNSMLHYPSTGVSAIGPQKLQGRFCIEILDPRQVVRHCLQPEEKGNKRYKMVQRILDDINNESHGIILIIAFNNVYCIDALGFIPFSNLPIFNYSISMVSKCLHHDHWKCLLGNDVVSVLNCVSIQLCIDILLELILSLHLLLSQKYLNMLTVWSNQIGRPDQYIGFTKPTENALLVQRSQKGDQEYLFADGVGIRTGDYFQFYHSDPTTALSSCNEVSKNFRKLKLDWSSRNCLQAGVSDNVCSKELVGGFVFSCCGRGESFFERCNVDSSPFLDNFPGVPMAGVFCRGEIGRGFSVLNADEGPEERTLHCCLHVYSTAYLLVSYTPAPPEH